MESFALAYPDGDERLRSLQAFAVGELGLEIGTGFLKAGTRMPDSGVSAHPRREITLILEGDLSTTSGGRTVRLGAGDVVSIPANQEQHSFVHQDTRLLWLFLGEN
ncbi:MAG: cupin domain-containing protein [Gammaproteobacteria bacterium]|nr:cupin domain-containing protein [Gammaproteobacteria bacterium]MYE50165.1 cupin domain-containing protein [Gammaproteobacteria bacterium]MYF51508.1 cupin domain-containing protein [Gammaproteobacteria bacterium]MYG14430.1 cupin domain-containing protein [Gammaproteobacteria bacterium]MYK29026.1 cupin domain-containing protein [Gammaproteobacteria bacterium]